VDPKSWTGPWKTITNPEDIAKVIIEMNRKQYHQAHGTPFGSGILANMVGHAGDSPITETLLAGEMHPLPQDILPESRHVLQTLATPYPMTTRTTQIEEEEFMASCRVAKESTSSSPSGRHIGHYKASLADPNLVALHTTMMSLPFQVGLIPSRWKCIIDIMLKKSPGDSRCDFNHAMRILIGRRLTHALEDHKMLPTMQFGSHPGRRCISAVL
jgi:hypothetical protein